jgi:hypothetical protein
LDKTENAYSPGGKYVGVILNFVDVPILDDGEAGTFTLDAGMETDVPAITVPADGSPSITLLNSIDTGNSESFAAKNNSNDVIKIP